MADTNISYSVLLLWYHSPSTISPFCFLLTIFLPQNTLPEHLYLGGSSSNLLNSSLKRRWVSTNDLADLLSFLENDEGWHGADADLLGHFWDVVDVHLDEVGGWVLLGEPGWGC